MPDPTSASEWLKNHKRKEAKPTGVQPRKAPKEPLRLDAWIFIIVGIVGFGLGLYYLLWK